MWIFTNRGMVSIVQKPGDTDTLTVRARVKGDIERVFPGVKAQAGGGTDYAYRARVPRHVVAQTLADLVSDLNYQNFKDSIKNDAHHDHCVGVWNVGWRHQQRMAPKQRGRQQTLGWY